MNDLLDGVIRGVERAQILAFSAEGGDDPRLIKTLSEVRGQLDLMRNPPAEVPAPVIEVPVEAPVSELPVVTEPAAEVPVVQ